MTTIDRTLWERIATDPRLGTATYARIVERADGSFHVGLYVDSLPHSAYWSRPTTAVLRARAAAYAEDHGFTLTPDKVAGTGWRFWYRCQ